MSGPYRTVTANDVRTAVAAIRASLRALDKPRWWRAALALGRLRQTGSLHEWVDVEWEIPAGREVRRMLLVAALADVLGGPAERVCALDRPAGQALHEALGQPTRVLVDAAANPAKRDEVLIAAVTGRSTTDRGVWVEIDDSALTWAPGPGEPKTYVDAEYNPSNDLLQQQGLKSAYPLAEIRALGREGAEHLIGQDRRLCGYLVLMQRNAGLQPTCAINGEGCSYKAPVTQNRTAWGTGGPKVLLERREQRPTGVPAPRATDEPHRVVDQVMKRHNPNGVILSPGWARQLRAAMGSPNTHPPAVDDVAALVAWLHPGPDGPVARPRALADLIGEDVMLQVCVR